MFELRARPGDMDALAADEIARADRFHFERDRNNFIAGRAQVRRILAAYLGWQPRELRFSYGVSGKPGLPGPVSFNVSHTGEIAALAVACFDLGVDIEKVRPIGEDIAERFFAVDEAARLRALPQDQQLAAFFALWSCKEAYVKARGDGLIVPLDQFSVGVEPDGTAALLRVGDDPAEPSFWQLHRFSPAPDVVGAIAARQRGWRVRALAAGSSNLGLQPI
jgi:4'-phosphopantetheinyl transferase